MQNFLNCRIDGWHYCRGCLARARGRLCPFISRPAAEWVIGAMERVAVPRGGPLVFSKHLHISNMFGVPPARSLSCQLTWRFIRCAFSLCLFGMLGNRSRLDRVSFACGRTICMVAMAVRCFSWKSEKGGCNGNLSMAVEQRQSIANISVLR